MTTRRFEVTFDYRCPFARNGHEHVVAAVRSGAEWEVSYRPFSLDQVHVEEGQAPIWDRPEEGTGLLALQYGIAARDTQPDAFLDVHTALFAARHDKGQRIQEIEVVLEALGETGADADALRAEVESGQPLKTIATEHTEAVERWGVFGVPTFLADDKAVFVRVMHRSGSGLGSQETVERILDYLVDWPDLNEFKRPRIPR